LQSGRDVILVLPEGEISPAISDLWVSFGAELEPGELRVDGSNQLRAIAPHQDFRSFPLQPNGTLEFGRAHPLRFSTARLSRLGRSLQPLAWTAPESTLWRSASDERSAPRRPLLSLLSPQSSREGRLVLASSDRVFSTGVLQAEDPTHRNLLRALLASEPSRLAFSRIRSERADTLPTLTARQRSIARSICIGAGPVLLLGLALFTRRRRAGAQPRARWNQGRFALAAFTLALLVPGLLALLLDRGAPRSWRADATRDGSHQLQPTERDFLVGCLELLERESGPLQIELVSTSDAQLPPAIRARKRDLLELLADWPLDATRQGEDSTWIVTDPERDWDEEERTAARKLGLTPRDLALSNVDGQTASLRVPELWCGLILRSGERRSFVSLLEEGGSLRFRVAFALWRLSEDEQIDIAFAADRGLLSSAEALLDYSERGLFAPTEGDATGAARSALRAAGFTLRELDTQSPAAELSKRCAEADALCWIQPRREIGPMLQAMTETLARGGATLLCAQHYEVEARQLGRDGLNIEFWPRPLKTDLERAYLPQLGIQLVKELYFDASAALLPLPMRVEAGEENGQVRDLQLGVQPFMVRATAPGLGELALPSASRILFDAERGRSYDLEMTPLVLGSPSWWSYDWSGGNLPPELLQRSGTVVEEAPRDPQVL
ncbi:MAG: Gldg family protein, partial [Planctomycetota bacterium]